MSTSDDPAVHRPEPPVNEDRYIGWRDLTAWRTTAGRRLVGLVRRAAGWVGPYPVLVVTVLLGALVATALTAASTEVYEAVAEDDGVATLDHPALRLALAARTPELNEAVTAFTNLGGPIGMPLLAATAAVVLAVWHRRWTPLVLMAVAGGGSLLMTVVGKPIVGRIRPPQVDAVPPYEMSASFPSGHALNAVVVAGVLAYLLLLRQRRWVARAVTVGAAALFALAMGLSRVFLGHHWLTDVLVAWTLGLAWLSAVVVAHRLYLTVRHVRRRRAS